MKIFHAREEAERYADKNYGRGTYKIEKTKHGNFRIVRIDEDEYRRNHPLFVE